MNGKLQVAARIGLAMAGMVAAYPVIWRRWCLTWGATAQEAARSLPGDELLPTPDLLSTRAITIEAPPAAIWPWLVQMGGGRAGAYTYDWLENLFGLDMHSADEIRPEFQKLAVGDVQPVGTEGPRMRVEILDPEHTLVFRSTDGTWVWAFVLRPAGTATRLLSRNRIAAPDASPAKRLLTALVREPGSLVMERRMLLGIKERVERAREPAPLTP